MSNSGDPSDGERVFFEVYAALGTDERRVLTVLARRLLVGQGEYGKLNLATDRRNWVAERAQEIQDMLIYSAFEELKRVG